MHRDDFKLLADFLAKGLFATAADASQFMLGQFVDDFDTQQIRRQRLALATPLDGGDDLLLQVFGGNVGDAFCLVEKASLGVAGSAVCSDLRPNKR